MLCNLVLTVAVLLHCFNAILAAENVDWWESGTFYQIYPRSFMDSNGDGIGDLNGITSRLEYLKEIGITATWLSPIFESPMVDNGYDIANFTNIDPLFGTMDDFDAMITKAHKLGLKILLDFVPNHSSDKCEWFQKSIRREEGYKDLYVWDDGKINELTGQRIPPSNWKNMFNTPAWTWNDERQQYYLHQFYKEQPDFNLTNPAMRYRLIEVLEYWLDRGVDGFRIDAVPNFIEKRFENGTYPDNPPKSNIYTQHLPETIDLLYEWRAYLDKYQQTNGGDTRILIGECYSPIDFINKTIGNGTHKGIQMPMNLNFMFRSSPNATEVENRVDNWMSVIWRNHKTANWVTGNHDTGRMTSLSKHKTDLITMVVHALPGASITYNGEEIGMLNGENTDGDFRNLARIPMQWNDSKNAGFSTSNSTWLPVHQNYKTINVKKERGTARSTLQIFKAMVNLKKTSAFKAFKEDSGFTYGALNDQVFQVVRTDSSREEYRVLVNFGNQTEYVEGLTNKTMEYILHNSYSPHRLREKVDLTKRIYLLPFEAVVLRWAA